MGTLKNNNELKDLPRYIIRRSKNWYFNNKTRKWIPIEKITDYLPKEVPVLEVKQDWTKNYYGN